MVAQRADAAGGLVGDTDPIPAYRLSGGSALPGRDGLRTLWRPELMPLLADADDLVVDLRSGPYAALGPARGDDAPGVQRGRVADEGAQFVVAQEEHVVGLVEQALVDHGYDPSLHEAVPL